MKIGSLFDGSGGFPLASAMCGMLPVWASEVEPFPIRVTTKRFPQMKHLGDISKVNGAEIEPVDVITFGSPCFPEGTLVLTTKGYENIEHLKVGDVVFTHKGNWKPISAIGYKTSKTVKLKGNHYGLIATPNHPFYSAEQGSRWNGNGYSRTLENVGEWTPAENMQGKRWAVPHTITGIDIPEIEKQNNYQHNPPEINKNLMYIIGRWIGDGWIRDGQRSGRPDGQTFGQICICANEEKSDYLEEKLKEVFDGIAAINKIQERTVNKFRVNNQALCKWIRDNFGVKADGKTLPAWVYCMDEPMRRALLKGYLDSDGWHFKENTWKATTVSKKLAHSIRLLAETLGYSCTVHYTKMKDKTTIEGRIVNQKPTYQVVLAKENRKTSITDDNYNWYKCRSVEPYSDEQTVYNITVEDDHSYIVEGFAVHNCQDLSVAGKRKGLNHSELGDEETTRSGLFMEAIRIIREMKEATNGEYPTFAVWENVPGAYSSNKGEDFRIVLEELEKTACNGANIVPKPSKGKWLNAGEILGDNYSIAWRTLDAQYWGVPQRRRRIYLVADFRGQRAGKILFEREGLRGNFTQGRTQGQGTAGNAENSIGTADRAKCVVYDGSSVTSPINAQNPELGDPCHTLNTDSRNYVVYAVENHPADSRVNIDDSGKVQTLTSRMGTGGGNVPLVMETAGFKPNQGAKAQGIGYEEETSPTLLAGQETAVCYSFDSLASNSMKSKNPHSGCRVVDKSKTLDTSTQDPSKNQGGICVVCYSNQAYDKWERNEVGTTLRASGGVYGGGSETLCIEPQLASGKDVAGCLMASGYEKLEAQEMFSGDYTVIEGFDGYNSALTGDKESTLGVNCGMSTGRNGVCCGEPHYIVRRLTPLECCRLQGFPDCWCNGLETPEPTGEDLEFWREVFETHRNVISGANKPKTDKQIIKWLKDPYSDSAIYKMWGNGICLQNALFVIQGIAEELKKEKE